MSNADGKSPAGFLDEIRLILSYARQVWYLLSRQHKVALGIGALLMAVVSGCNTAFPLLLGKLLDEVKSGIDEQLAAQGMYRIAGLYLGLIAGVFLLREVLQLVRRYLIENACTRIEKAMTVNAVSHLMKMELTSLSEDKIGALQGRISRSIVGFVRFIRLAFLDFFPPVLTGIFALVAVVTKQPLLAMVMVAVIPIALFLTLKQLSSQKGVRLELIRSREEMDGAVVELLGGLEYVRAANTHEEEIRRVGEAAERRRLMENRHQKQMSMFGFIKALNEAFFHILVLALAAYLAINGTISYGDILTFSFLFANVMAPINEVHRGLDEGHECSLMVADLMKILTKPPDPSFAPLKMEEPQAVSGQPILVVENLSVVYPTVSGTKCILKNVNITAKHGETIGLAGPSGCGKTTWLRVLLRLAHPTEGKVLIGGVPLEGVSREAIGRLVGYVAQSPFIFAGTVEENIRYGSAHVSKEAIEHAARRACIHEEIVQMPGHYGALIKERGMNLSAGQRQRLALARVFLKDPPILILDEGTSALDNISERHIQQAIDLARKDRTVILVAHRLSTLLDADRIYVFQGGQVVEMGTYTELYQRGGVFAELVNCARSGVTDVGVANGKMVV